MDMGRVPEAWRMGCSRGGTKQGHVVALRTPATPAPDSPRKCATIDRALSTGEHSDNTRRNKLAKGLQVLT